jgi:hypothetical protein
MDALHLCPHRGHAGTQAVTINSPKPGVVTMSSAHVRKGRCHNCEAHVMAVDGNVLPKNAYVLCGWCDHVTLLVAPEPELQSQAL